MNQFSWNWRVFPRIRDPETTGSIRNRGRSKRNKFVVHASERTGPSGRIRPSTSMLLSRRITKTAIRVAARWKEPTPGLQLAFLCIRRSTNSFTYARSECLRCFFFPRYAPLLNERMDRDREPLNYLTNH